MIDSWIRVRFLARAAAALALLAQAGAAQLVAPTKPPQTTGHLFGLVTATPGSLDLGVVQPADPSPTAALTLQNLTGKGLRVTSLALAGDHPGDFSFTGAPSAFDLRAGAKVQLSVAFAPSGPTSIGERRALLEVRQSVRGSRVEGVIAIPLRAVALGPPGEPLLLNVGGATYGDTLGRTWVPAFGAGGGVAGASIDPIQGSDDDALLQTFLEGQVLSFELPLPKGPYDVTLHFAETRFEAAGKRRFDVRAESAWPVLGLDLFAVAGHDTAHAESFRSEVQDGGLSLLLFASTDAAVLSAIEIRKAPILALSPVAIDFGGVETGTLARRILILSNAGEVDLDVDQLAFRMGPSGDAQSFRAELAGVYYPGADLDFTYPFALSLAPGDVASLGIEFTPSDETFHQFELELAGDFGVRKVPVNGLGGHAGHPFLHVVLDVPERVVDYDGDGLEAVLLDGTQSHTHEPGQALAGYTWREDGIAVASGPLASASFALGQHAIELSIADDNVPPETLAGVASLAVVPASAIPGVLALYYGVGSGSAGALLDAPPALADFGEVRPTLSLAAGTPLGGSAFTSNVVVRMLGRLSIGLAATYELTAAGGADRRLFVDGALVAGPLALAVGVHDVDVRWSVGGQGDLPLELLSKLGTGAPKSILAEHLTHDESALPPLINDMPSTGTVLGGNKIDIYGLGFFPASAVVVRWGGLTLTSADFQTVAPTLIRFDSPPGTGVVAVTVQTPQGTSNARTFTYDDNAPVAVYFNYGTSIPMAEPTSGDWGPDGRFWVGKRNGELVAVRYDQDYNIVSTNTYPGVSGESSFTILGLAFDPFDAPGSVRVFVAHGELFAQGGSTFSGPSPYSGQISVLAGPGFDTPQAIVTGLPVSNHDHGVNGLQFDNNGDLLVCVGGNTNAGIKHQNMGDLPESPLSGAILKAKLSRPDFHGVLAYVETQSGLPNDDQVFGEIVDLAPGTHVGVHASGLRNSYDLVYTTKGRLYATDNGPNFGTGVASTGPDTQGSQAQDNDELDLIERGVYYGHPNRARGRTDARQNIYRGMTGASIVGEFRQALDALPPSCNGICEYRSAAFGGQMRGDLLVQKWLSYVRRIRLTDDGRTVLANANIFPWTGSLDVQGGPGGALVTMDQLGNFLRVLVPHDPTLESLAVLDITPWRAPATGGNGFVIGGAFFGDPTNTSVRIGGLNATLTSVSARRIQGSVPTHSAPPTELVDVVVTVNGVQTTLPQAFRFLGPRGSEPGHFEDGADMPLPLGEVACGLVGGVICVVGEGFPQTLAYDVLARTWSDDRAQRPFAGHHHGVEVIGGKLFLIGGLQFGSEGRVQIYDPVLNAWTLGAALPWAAGSVQTAAIGGKIYAAGGIVGNSTVDNCAVYDPAKNTWTALAPMPTGKGRNHAAAATDGKRLFIFGGRGQGSGSGNFLANGFDDVQVYDPLTNTWSASFQPGSALVPLPQKRGGMGKAVFYDGEFYVFGGETVNGGGATFDGVYARVDVYDPATNTWRAEAPLPTPRHGFCPVLVDSRMFIPGGGTKAGFSLSSVMEIFTRQ